MLSSRFYGDATTDEYEFLVVEDRGFAWAKEAEGLAFASVCSPSEDNLVTLINLTIFYHARGSWKSVLVCECNSVCAAQILRSTRAASGESRIAAEISRRRLWAAYLLHIFVSQPALSWVRAPDENAVLVPCPEEHFTAMSADGFASNFDLSGIEENLSYHAQLIRLTRLWSEVHGFLENMPASSEKKLSTFAKLDAQLQNWRVALPNIFEVREDNVMVDKPLMERNQLAMLHTLYHSAVCCLHASVVPLFSFCSVDEDLAQLRMPSAATAFAHARSISSMLQKCKQARLSLSAGFFGFACYCSLAVQIPFLWCKDVGTRDRTRTNMDVNFQLMEYIGSRWKIASCLTFANVNAMACTVIEKLQLDAI
ncbi:unnamed protein product [Clonostachys rosea]|uniref:Transcription factor domain-containing protein n=1 Tax=Bionectria ochroleuca TaxID=29856 RepID=A0ABY6UQD0_BIOOC|nr:unnamed protein product [Clonostachys rosea]